MMRAFGKLAAMAALLAAAPASAQVVQSGSNTSGVPAQFTHFDSSLGALTGVNLQVTAVDNRSGFTFGAGNVSWAVNGDVALTIARVGGTSLPVQTFSVAGSGNAAMRAAGTFDYSASGSGNFNLDPSFFLYDSPLSYDFTISALDDGFATGGDTNLDGHGAATTVLAGRCFGGAFGGSEFCNSIQYTLTYNYTPLDAASPVPEPATWATMIVGLFVAGAALRRTPRSRRMLVA